MQPRQHLLCVVVLFCFVSLLTVEFNLVTVRDLQDNKSAGRTCALSDVYHVTLYVHVCE